MAFRGERALKRFIKVFWIVALFGAGLWIGSTFISNADGLVDPNMPGTANDPIVTKSYVDEAVGKLVSEQLAKQSGANSSLKLVVVELKAGQKLYGGEGAEFIIRTGKAVAFSGDASGIPDLTGAKDLTAGMAIPLNHHLLFPREGRGIQADPKEKHTIYVMVRGPYRHVDANGNQLN
jgi:hypothetical protein